MRNTFLLIIWLLILSCSDQKKQTLNKTEFFHSKTTNLILVKNEAHLNNSLLKEEIINYLKKNPPKSLVEIYEFSPNTEYFLENEEDDGGPTSSHFLSNYQSNEGIAIFGFIKCENDSTKKIGIIRYYEKYGGFYQADTIINKCE